MSPEFLSHDQQGSEQREREKDEIRLLAEECRRQFLKSLVGKTIAVPPYKMGPYGISLKYRPRDVANFSAEQQEIFKSWEAINPDAADGYYRIPAKYKEIKVVRVADLNGTPSVGYVVPGFNGWPGGITPSASEGNFIKACRTASSEFIKQHKEFSVEFLNGKKELAKNTQNQEGLNVLNSINIQSFIEQMQD